MNADEHKSLGGQYGVQGFPTIKIFGANKKKPEDYNGNRNAQGFVDAGLAAAKKLVNAQLGGKSSGGKYISFFISNLSETFATNVDQLIFQTQLRTAF